MGVVHHGDIRYSLLQHVDTFGEFVTDVHVQLRAVDLLDNIVGEVHVVYLPNALDDHVLVVRLKGVVDLLQENIEILYDQLRVMSLALVFLLVLFQLYFILLDFLVSWSNAVLSFNSVLFFWYRSLMMFYSAL